MLKLFKRYPDAAQQYVNGFAAAVYWVQLRIVRSSFFASFSKDVWATWIDPGPSSSGSPQLESLGMSVVNLAIIVGNPSTPRSRRSFFFFFFFLPVYVSFID